MELSYLIMEVLKKHSSERKLEDIHSLNQKEIFNLLQKDFSGFKDITEKKVRAALAKTAGSPGIGLLTS